MSACVCPTTGWPDPDCPKHGLPGDTRYPPMNRHAREITIEEERVVKVRGGVARFTVEVTRKETAAEVQRRLHDETRGRTS